MRKCESFVSLHPGCRRIGWVKGASLISRTRMLHESVSLLVSYRGLGRSTNIRATTNIQGFI